MALIPNLVRFLTRRAAGEQNNELRLPGFQIQTSHNATRVSFTIDASNFDSCVKLWDADTEETVECLIGLVDHARRRAPSAGGAAICSTLNANVFFIPALASLTLCLILPTSSVVQRMAAVATTFACGGLFFYGWKSYLRYTRMLLPPLLLILALVFNPIYPLMTDAAPKQVAIFAWCGMSVVAILILLASWLTVREHEAKFRSKLR